MMPETSGCRRAGGQGVRVVNSEEPLGCLVYANPALCLVLPDISQPVGWLTHTPMLPPGCDRVLVSHAAVSADSSAGVLPEALLSRTRARIPGPVNETARGKPTTNSAWSQNAGAT